MISNSIAAPMIEMLMRTTSHTNCAFALYSRVLSVWALHMGDRLEFMTWRTSDETPISVVQPGDKALIRGSVGTVPPRFASRPIKTGASASRRYPLPRAGDRRCQERDWARISKHPTLLLHAEDPARVGGCGCVV